MLTQEQNKINEQRSAERSRSKLVPKLRFKEFEGGWAKKDFGSIVEKAKSKHDPLKSKEEYPCIEMESIAKESSILLNIFNSKDQLSIKNKFNKGEVLFGKLRPNLKKYVVAPFDGVCSSEIWVLKGIELSNEFLFRLIQTNKFYSSTLVTSGSKMPRADWAYISSSIFPVPTLPEQQKIASFLSAVDEKIQQLNKKKELLAQYKKGVMQQLFSGKLRFKDEDGNDYPEWEEKLFKDIVIEYRLGGNYTNTEAETIYPLIKMGNLGRGKIKLTKLEYIPLGEDIDPKDQIEYGDLFFNTRNTLDLVGKVSIWRNELPVAYYNSNLMYLKFENNFFMNYRLNSYDGVKGLKRFATGTTSVAAIYTKDLLKLYLNMPCVSEQQKIATYLSSLDIKIESISNQISQAQTFKKGLLQRMFI